MSLILLNTRQKIHHKWFIRPLSNWSKLLLSIYSPAFFFNFWACSAYINSVPLSKTLRIFLKSDHTSVLHKIPIFKSATVQRIDFQSVAWYLLKRCMCAIRIIQPFHCSTLFYYCYLFTITSLIYLKHSRKSKYWVIYCSIGIQHNNYFSVFSIKPKIPKKKYTILYLIYRTQPILSCICGK